MAVYATGTSGTIGRYLSSDVIPLKIDLCSINWSTSLPEFLHDDTIIHLAGIVGSEAVAKDYNKSYSVNVVGTLNLADYFLKRGAKRFIYASTSHVYARSSASITEEYDTYPQNVYAKQKLKAESNLVELFQGNLDKICITRIFSVLDWGMPSFTLGGAINQLTDVNSSFMLKNSDDVRDFLTPRTIAQTLESLSKKDSLPNILNLCSGKGTKISDAAERMLSASRYEIPHKRIQSGHSANPFLVGDNSKLRQLLPDSDLQWMPSSLSDIKSK